MSLKKRAAAATAATSSNESNTKRQKTCRSAADSEKNFVDLTARNAIDPPLLRLPAELRNAIWILAFGEMILDVETRYLHWPGGRAVLYYRCFASNSISPIGVHKIFLSSCTFNFNTSRTFLDFAISNQKIVPQVRKMNVKVIMDWSENMRKTIPQEFSAFAVGQLQSLEGVDIEFVYSGMLTHGMVSNIMNHSAWRYVKMLDLIRGFQQHTLKESLTTVVMRRAPHWLLHNPEDYAAAAASIRACLLDHQPTQQAT